MRRLNLECTLGDSCSQKDALYQRPELHPAGLRGSRGTRIKPCSSTSSASVWLRCVAQRTEDKPSGFPEQIGFEPRVVW